MMRAFSIFLMLVCVFCAGYNIAKGRCPICPPCITEEDMAREEEHLDALCRAEVEQTKIRCDAAMQLFQADQQRFVEKVMLKRGMIRFECEE